jgi:hypothetical protein
MNIDPCRVFFNETCARISGMLQSKHPEAINEGLWDFAMAHHRELYDTMKKNDKEVNDHWKNGNFAEFKKFCLEWGRNQLEMYRLYALHLRQLEARHEKISQFQRPERKAWEIV